MKIIDENSRFRITWDSLVLASILISCLVVPFQTAFKHSLTGSGIYAIYLVDLVFFIDIFLNFFTSFRRRGEEVTTKKETIHHYLGTFFFIDLLANLPLDLIFLATPNLNLYGIPLVLVFRGFRLLRIVRLYVIIHRWQAQNWINPGYLRIIKSLTTILIFLHCIACLWFMTALVSGFPEDCWAVKEGIANATPSAQYVRSLYWTITTMTTVGYGDITPSTTIEYWVSIVVMLMGASMYAFIIGTVASLFSNLDSAKVSYWNRIEAVTQYLRSRQVPHDLNVRVRDYYDYLWDIHRGFREDTFLDDLPESMRIEVLLNLTQDLLNKVPLFKHCSVSLRNVLLKSLKMQINAPDDYVSREGEPGREIYFISRGTVEILSGEENQSHGTLGSGEYFGHMSLLFGEKRTASVKSQTYCELFILKKEDFDCIRTEYPELKEVLKKMSSEKTEKVSALLLEGIVL
jgi:CRP-like cAMP-binding protein